MTASARGLFRATGKKAKAVPVRRLDGTYEKSDFLEREADDFYPTPPEPTLALLSVEGNRMLDFPVVWEAAAGDGAMVRQMRDYGLTVVASDLVDRGCGATISSFYDFTSDTALAKAIVTNPPPMLNAWFIWDKAHEGETILRMLDRKDARQGELL